MIDIKKRQQEDKHIMDTMEELQKGTTLPYPYHLQAKHLCIVNGVLCHRIHRKQDDCEILQVVLPHSLRQTIFKQKYES